MKVLPHPGLPVLDVWLPGDLPAAVAGHTGDVLEHLPQHQLLQRRYGQRCGPRASSGRLRGGSKFPESIYRYPASQLASKSKKNLMLW